MRTMWFRIIIDKLMYTYRSHWTLTFHHWGGTELPFLTSPFFIDSVKRCGGKWKVRRNYFTISISIKLNHLWKPCPVNWFNWKMSASRIMIFQFSSSGANQSFYQNSLSWSGRRQPETWEKVFISSGKLYRTKKNYLRLSYWGTLLITYKQSESYRRIRQYQVRRIVVLLQV